MTLPLADKMKFGVQTIHRRTEPAVAPWTPEIDDGREIVELVDRLGFDSLWTGDHVAFAIPILDPFIQLAQAATWTKRLTLGTAIYLLPLRHPGPVAKQVSTLDHLTGGRFIFGCGVGGEFPGEFSLCGIPVKERGARLSESLDVVRKLWTGEKVSHDGKFFSFPDVQMLPATRQPGGPPIWLGGRSDAALKRTGRKADGWMSYVVTPEMYAAALEKIAAAAEEIKRPLTTFDTSHLLFLRIDHTFEEAWDKATAALSTRYAMDFRGPAKKYCALGTPADVAAAIERFHAAGTRHIILDFVGPYEERDTQIEWFAKEVRPLLGTLA